MSRNLRARIARLERQRLPGRTTSKVASFWDFIGAASQGRQEEADALWMQLPEEDRAYLVATLDCPDALVVIEARINAPLVGLPCGLRELPSDGGGEKN